MATNMLKKYEYQHIIDKPRQLAQTNKNLLLVEGEGDLLFINKLLEEHPERSRIVVRPCDGKINVINIASELQKNKIKHYSIVDSDYDYINIPQFIFRYAYRDFEGMILASGGLRHIMDHYSSHSKKDFIKKFLPLLHQYEDIITKFKYINQKESLGINFKLYFRRKNFPLTREFKLNQEKFISQMGTLCKSKKNNEFWLGIMNGDLPDKLGPSGKDTAYLLSVLFKNHLNSLAIEHLAVINTIHAIAPQFIDTKWKSDFYKYLDFADT